MEVIVCDVGRDMITDESLCQIFETCLSMACQIRRGDLLRRSAEMTMIKLTEMVFASVRNIEPETATNHKFAEDDELQMSEPSKQEDIVTETSKSANLDAEHSSGTSENLEPKSTQKRQVVKPFERYGLPSIREYLRVLISIIDTANFHQYTDATRIMALHLINVAFEVSGSYITRHDSLLNLTTDTLLKQLLQLVRMDNPFLLQRALRVFGTIFNTSKQHLKLHQEAFLTYMLTCLSPMNDIPREAGIHGIFYDGVPSVLRTVVDASPHPSKVSTPAARQSTDGDLSEIPSFVVTRSSESREIMVEALASFARMPSFFPDLFVNYDCDVDRADLCVDLVSFLCRNAYPDSAIWSTPSVPPMCLEAILSFLKNLSRRLKDYGLRNRELATEAMSNRTRKKLVIEATECFNQNPSHGLAFLVKHKLIPDDTTLSSVKFLRNSGRINKKLLGEFLAKPKNKEYLDFFIEDFDFSHKSLDEAMRDLFAAFRLPGESQQIERIIEKFANHYVSSEGNKDHVADGDSAFVLSYAVIMLNTDLHNPQVKSHMTIDQFKKNLRKTNGGADFAPEYLESIYYAIKHREIIIPEEHDNEESFEHAWKDILLKSQHAGTLKSCDTNMYDMDLFESTWRPIVTMLSYVFATATDDTVISRVITAFEHVSSVAAYYEIPEAINKILTSLCKITTLTEGDQSAPITTVQMQHVSGQITVSDLSIQFGGNFKAQLALAVMFRLAKTNLTSIQSSWKDLVPIFTNIYLYSLTNLEFLELHEKHSVVPLPPSKPAHVFETAKPVKETGLFSALSSYITGNIEQVPEPSEEAVDATLSAIKCVNSCAVFEFLKDIYSLPQSKRLNIVTELGMARPNAADKPSELRPKYYAGILFILDILTMAALESKDIPTMRSVISILREAMSEWEAEETDYLTRILVYYFSIILNGTTDMTPDLDQALETTTKINDLTLIPCMSGLVLPLTRLANESSWAYGHIFKQDKLWQLLRIGAANRESADTIFSFVRGLLSTPKEKDPKSIGLRYFTNILGVLNEISSTGASGARLEKDKSAIFLEFGQHFSRATATKKGNALIALIEGDVERAIAALDFIASLETEIEAVALATDSDAVEIWRIYVRTLSQQCMNPCDKIKTHAFKCFQKAMESSPVNSREDFDWMIAM